ncbi:MAG TPA: response regulator transcription factor [Spirochaetota bacterium]|nr:response regulator transcription factor [Spirochaetota bacterium]
MAEDDKNSKIRILIVENNIVLRKGLSQLLNFEDDITVCGVTSTVSGALELLELKNTDLIILDIALNGVSGMDLLKEVAKNHLQIPIIVLSMHEESYFIDRSLHIGARGYILKQDAPETIVEAIHKVLDGEIFISKSLTHIPAQKGIAQS